MKNFIADYFKLLNTEKLLTRNYIIGIFIVSVFELAFPIVLGMTIAKLFYTENSVIEINNYLLLAASFFILKLIMYKKGLLLKYNSAIRMGYFLAIKAQKNIINFTVGKRRKVLKDDFSRVIHSEANNVAWRFFIPLSDLIQEIILMVALCIVVIYLESRVILAIILALIIIIIYKKIFKRSININNESLIRLKMSTISDIIMNGAFDTLNQIDKVWLVKKIDNNFKDILDLQLGAVMAGINPRIQLESFLLAAILLIVYSKNTYNLEISSSGLILTLVLIRVALSASRIVGAYSSIQSGKEIASHSLNTLLPAIVSSDFSTEDRFKIHKRCEEQENVILKFTGLEVGYEGAVSIKIPNMTLHNNSKLAIYGRSGSGKTTLLRTLSLTLPLIEGDISYYGLSPESYSEEIFYLPQNPHIFPGTLLENLALSDKFDEDSSKLKKICYQSLNRLGFSRDKIEELLLLEDISNKISGGEAQRIALARVAFKENIKIIFLDEPTASLDSESISFFKKYINGLNIPIVFNTHDKSLLIGLESVTVINL